MRLTTTNRFPQSSAVSFSAALYAMVIVLLLVAVGCRKAEEEPATAVVSIQAEKAEQKDLTEYVSGDAVLSPQSESALASKISAPVKRFLVQRGAHVRQGQLLAVLEDGDLAASVTDTRGSLTQAQAAYDTSIKAQIPEDLQKAQLDVAQAKAQLDVARSTVDARKGLLDQGAIPRRDYETANASYVQTKAVYDLAVRHLASLNAVSQKASIAGAEGALVSARGKYQAATAGLGYAELRSPIDGVVTDRPLFAGEMAQAGQAVVTVMDTSSLIAKVHLSQSQTQGLKVGADAVVTISGVVDPVKGKVSLISPALDAGSTTLEVWVKVANRDGALRAGSPAKVQIAVQTLKDIIAVPNESIVATKSGDPAVMVIGADGAAKSTPVKTGITDGHDMQILSGLNAGEQVVTRGAYGMDDGTKVKVVAPGAGDDDDANPAAGEPAAKGDDK
jgi:HlyD family secretion protein